ncbi:NAD(P)/FAD-dependent oxidoreductase [Minwuia thermotolerans]|uniref:Cytochrome C n=1 Tax=Minwuia thermotolerans TaxID=2056226 RepID=A0A2M9G6V7_9PROT|nr:NAD(P)/FAD-dependent oxidoreductase [Minwuia thermotolerans]PJK31458.1 cytochrome C [Minwuia thermotolerans]
MKNISRRGFGKAALATGITIMVSGKAAAQRRYDVVVIGGGFGGATAAKYLRKFEPKLSVALIEQNRVFHTCPFSNLVIGGLRPLNAIAHNYLALSKRWGIDVIHQRAGRLNPSARTVRLADGPEIGFEKAIVSPGVDFDFQAIEGYGRPAMRTMPHAWKAGPQTRELRDQLREMEDGGLVIIAPPMDPFRCPPGPYERASMIAHYLKTRKPRSKILILDPKTTFSKEALFKQAWERLYPGMIEHLNAADDGRVVRVDPDRLEVETAFGARYRGAVVNIIPPQFAGVIAGNAGLANEDGWCPVNPVTFESRMARDIHIIGDAAIAGAMPKSGFSANSQGKIAALNVAAALTGRDPVAGSFANTCYSILAPDYGISVAKVYRTTDDGIVGVEGSGGLSPMDADAGFRAAEAHYAQGWYEAVTADMFT